MIYNYRLDATDKIEKFFKKITKTEKWDRDDK